MATKSENAEIAVLQSQVLTVKDDIKEVKADVKEVKDIITGANDIYVSKVEFAAFKRQYWLSHTLTALLTAIVVATVEYIVLNILQRSR